MNNLNPKAPGHSDDYHTAAAVATIWAVLLVLVAGFELASLLMSHSMLAGVLH